MRPIYLPAIIALMVIPTLSTTAASFTSYTDRATFEATASPVTTETFASYTSDLSFNNTVIDIGDFSISTNFIDTSTYNFIDASPFASPELNSVNTSHLRVGTNFGDILTLTFDTPITAFGADFTHINDSLLRTNIHIGDFSFTPAVYNASGYRFLGFISDTPFTTVQLRGLINDGYGIDNITYATASPIPTPSSSIAGLIGFALLTLNRRRNTTK